MDVLQRWVRTSAGTNRSTRALRFFVTPLSPVCSRPWYRFAPGEAPVGQPPLVAVGKRPVGIVASQETVWVANNGSDSVTKLRANDGATLGTFPVGEGPLKLAFEGTNVWVTNYVSGTVMRLGSDGTVLGTFATGDGAGGLVFDGRSVWVANNALTCLRCCGRAMVRDG
jgi:hypothetical protein